MSQPNRGADSRSLGELVSSLTEQFSTLVRGEIELAQLNLKSKLTAGGIGGALLAAAGVLALYMFGLLLLAAAWAFSNIMPMWAALLVVSAILLVIIAALGAVGAMKLKASKAVKVDPKCGLMESVEAAKKGLKHE